MGLVKILPYGHFQYFIYSNIFIEEYANIQDIVDNNIIRNC